MISVISILKRFTLCTLLLCSYNVFTQSVLTTDNLNSDWENWTQESTNNYLSNASPIRATTAESTTMNQSDTSDTENLLYRAPIAIDGKHQLYFDGVDDYVEDSTLISEWSEITLMGWIKTDSSGSMIQTICGQDNFSLFLVFNRLVVKANSTTLTYSTPLPNNQWIHVGATYSDTENRLKLYINGKEVSTKYLNGPLNTDTTPFYIGRRHNGSDKWFYNGNADEIRLFNKALSDDEIQKLVYQEIEDNGKVRGTEISRDISSLSWSNLIKYYRFDSFRDNITDNLTTPGIDVGTGASLHNISSSQIQAQTAPMPFVTQSSGNLVSSLTNASAGINGADAITYDWSIVKIAHDGVNYNDSQVHLGLIVNENDASSNPIEYNITNDSELNVSWYLKLDGSIDLEGESQLVQGDESILEPTSKGKIERDQQGTADMYTYNYWSSPVKIQNSASNNFRVSDIMNDGSDSNNPSSINFSSSGYDGAATNPIKIADYWIWKYANLPTGTYSAWQHVRRTGTIFPGEGYTMKGPGTGSVSTPQNYVFSGKPNNGDINLTLAANNDYLVGNPYPSAIDANLFILDNGPELDYDNSPVTDSTPLISGTLYFWEHWGGGSHYLQDYQGGYATYNFSGAVAAAYKGDNYPELATGGIPTKKPGRYIPVGQGFFVTGENSGTINFNNAQRVFKKESTSSVFMRSANTTASQNNEAAEEEDLRMKFRIGFNSINTIRRQLLLTIDDNATPNEDWAYDGKLNETQIDDMYWVINDNAYIIQGSNEAEISTIYPLGIKTNMDGLNTIMLDDLENVPDAINIYLHDIALDIYHDLRASDYEIFLNAGEYLNRFEITFATPDQLLSIDDQVVNQIDVIYSNDIKKVVIVNPSQLEIKSMTLYNMLGQSVYNNNTIAQRNYSEYNINNLSVGTYIIKLQTQTGSLVTKKVLIK
ncbi:LamG-like jellyroll fold domain-containing protein [Winogradskyella sp. Asnod2-B02-A]|uniref:LamG-like jellyroll fold domain-containing protein n=1 Tax=Winogradskyella sp. Asnod2-B02-A TaxID=3160583 RepID=UPI003866728A